MSTVLALIRVVKIFDTARRIILGKDLESRCLRGRIAVESETPFTEFVRACFGKASHWGVDLMQTFRKNRATLLLGGALALAASATISAQQAPVVDAAVLKNAGTPADPFPGSWLTY